MQPKRNQPGLRSTVNARSQYAKQRQSGHTLTSLALNSSHSHCLRSSNTKDDDSTDSPSHFIPEYMRKNTQNRDARPRGQSGSPRDYSYTELPASIPSTEDRSLIDSHEDLHRPTIEPGNVTPTSAQGTETPKSSGSKQGGHGDGLNNNKGPISLEDVMIKLNSLTNAVGKIDSMARDIDNIAEDVKSIKALQETTVKLTQDMS